MEILKMIVISIFNVVSCTYLKRGSKLILIIYVYKIIEVETSLFLIFIFTYANIGKKKLVCVK